MIAEVKRWLAKPGNTKAVLSSRLGYETTDALSKWLSRNRIPQHRHADVRRAIATDGEGN